jgi:hypothetical protein
VYTPGVQDEKGKPIKALNKAQWKQRWDEFLFSKDKSSPGNHLFGVMHDILPKK